MFDTSSGTVVIVCLLSLCFIELSECRTYHLAFLGRNVTSLNEGTLIATSGTAGIYPNLTVTHGNPECISYEHLTAGSSTTKTTISNLLPIGCAPVRPTATAVTNTGFKVETDSFGPHYELHVYQVGATDVHDDAYLAIPDEFLGNAYYVITYCSTGGFCQFSVTAVKNNTAVNIVFPKNITSVSSCVDGFPVPSSAPIGSNVPIMLNEYQVFNVESLDDLSGTYIVADELVAVVVGSRDVPNDVNGQTSMIEQVPPVNRWGTEFVVAPNYNNNAGDLIKIVSQANNTVVRIQGFSAFNMEQKGDVVVRRIDWEYHSRIITSHPVLIMQIMSVDLYNDSTNVHGKPTMVLVPHIEQWVKQADHFCITQRVVAMVARSDESIVIPIQPSPTTFMSPWTEVPGSTYSVQSFAPETMEMSIIESYRFSAYMQCAQASAVLMSADWTYENEGCVETAPSPGDGQDNDCNGFIDEEICVQYQSFVSTKNATGVMTYKIMPVLGSSAFFMHVTTCDLAVVKLYSSEEPSKEFTLLISPYDVNGIPVNLTTDCSVRRDYYMKWSKTGGITSHDLRVGVVGESSAYLPKFDTDILPNVSYDRIVMSSLMGEATFQSHLYEGDCKEVVDLPDDFGREFEVPVKKEDLDFTIYIVTGSIGCDVTLVDITITLGPMETQEKTKIDFDGSNYWDGIQVEASCDVAVYLYRTDINTRETFVRVLPNDILGPTYLLYESSLSEAANTTNPVVCEVWPVHSHFDVDCGVVNMASSDASPIHYYDLEDLNIQNRLECNRVTSVFCGTFDEILVQMPPLTTLGTKFYIPKLDLNQLNAKAKIYLLASEDSTVVTIRGDYDQLDPVDLTGENYTRTIYHNTTFDISSTKPIQVHLEIWSTAGGWSVVVNIPSVSHYKNEHVFPKFQSEHNIEFGTAIDQNGDDVINLIPLGPVTLLTPNEFPVYSLPTFTLTVVRFPLLNKNVVITSDTWYNVTNEDCAITRGYPGDGIDNDCDGLIDEETCLSTNQTDFTDVDIDGNLFEDCELDTAPPVELTQNIPPEIPECAVDYSQEPEVISIEVGGTDMTGSWTIPSTPPPDPAPTFAPYEPVGGSVVIITTLPPPGDTTGPVEESCQTDCVCPCGWIHSQNYTEEEIELAVEILQQKLKVSKNELSSTIRKKSSAQDNRTSAKAVGYVGLVFMVVTISSIVLLDVTTLIRELKNLFQRLKRNDTM